MTSSVVHEPQSANSTRAPEQVFLQGVALLSREYLEDIGERLTNGETLTHADAAALYAEVCSLHRAITARKGAS